MVLKGTFQRVYVSFFRSFSFQVFVGLPASVTAPLRPGVLGREHCAAVGAGHGSGGAHGLELGAGVVHASSSSLASSGPQISSCSRILSSNVRP